MPDRPDPIDLMREAMKDSQQRYVETVRQIRDDEVQRPLIGERLTKDQRIAGLAGLLSDPAQLFGVMDEMKVRYKLPTSMVPTDKVIPKRLAEYLNRVMPELKQAMEEQT